MSVDKKILEDCISQASGGDKEMADFMRAKYESNDALAVKFVAGYMTSSDYTKKTQELAEQRKQFENQNGQVDNLRKALEAAENEKNTILKELAGQRISTAKARELMLILRDKYTLTDDDLPGMSDLIETRKTGKPVDSSEDLDKRFTTFGDDLMARMEKKFVSSMMPEIGAMASVPLIWSEIDREHTELTGKPLSFTEKQELLKLARDATDSSLGKGSIMGIWQDKYNIGGEAGLRMQKRDEKLRTQWQSDWEKSEADKRSKAALEIVTPSRPDLGSGAGISPAFKTQFKQFPTDPNAQPNAASGKPSDGVPSLKVEPGQHVRQTGDRGATGAQRAAAKFLERTATGGYGRKTA